MDLLTDTPLPIALAVLALADGLSIGTLLIPLFLLIAPGRPRGGRILLYLGTIAAFYLVVGILMMLGLVNVIGLAAEFIDSTGGQIALLVLGAALLVTAFVIPTGSAQGEAPGGGRLTRWRDRMLDPSTRSLAVMGVALAAGIVEVASMLPYLIGMTMIANEPIGIGAQYGLLAAYCLVMILPALVLLAGRVLAARLVERPLARLADWMARTGAENTAWLVGIAGFFIARGAATRLGLLSFLS